MAWIIIDGFDDRGDVDDDYDNENEEEWMNDGWGLYEYLWEGDDYPPYMKGILQTGRYDSKGAFSINHDGLYHWNATVIVPISGDEGNPWNECTFGCAIRSGIGFLQLDQYDGSRFRPGIELETNEFGQIEVRGYWIDNIYRSKGNLFTNFGWSYVSGRIGIGLGDGNDYVYVEVNGEVVVNLTGINLDPNAYGGFGDVTFPDTGYENDDMYFNDNDATLRGEQRIIALFPNAAGLDGDFSPGTYDQVDELDQDFAVTINVSDGTNGHRDSFHLTQATDQIPAGTVTAVVARIFAQATASEQLRPYVVISDTRYYGTTQSLESARYTYIEHIWENNPATSNPWTLAEIDSVQVGYEVVS